MGTPRLWASEWGALRIYNYLEFRVVFVSIEKYTCVFPSLQMIATGQVKLCLAEPGVIFVQLPFLSGFEVELQGR